MKQFLGDLKSKLFEGIDETRNEQSENRFYPCEGFIRIPAHYVNEDWIDDWEITSPELIHDTLLSDEESIFDPNRNEHE